MTEMKCPCCGQSMGPITDPKQIPMSAVRQTIMKRLPATIEQLAVAVYGSRDNTATDQYQSLRMTISHMRKLLAPHGWTINKSQPGRDNAKTYRLMRLP